jgi:hypothetical protein
MIKIYLQRLILKTGYCIRGFHHIYLKKSNHPYVIEFIGLGGKTFLLKKLSKRLNLTRVKPNFLNLDSKIGFDSGVESFLRSFHGLLLGRDNFYSIYNSVLEKLVILNKYVNYKQFWDEGIVKKNIRDILELYEIDQESVIKFIKNFVFIVVLPESTLLIADRYSKRDNTEVTEEFIEEIESKKQCIVKFVEILETHGLNYTVVSGSDFSSNLELIENFLMRV